MKISAIKGKNCLMRKKLLMIPLFPSFPFLRPSFLRRQVSISFTIALLLLIAAILFAGSGEDSLRVRRVYEIEGIKVVGESMAKKIGYVHSKEIDENMVSTDISVGEIISDMPGLFIFERGKGESIIRFRGFEDRHVSVFIDGMPVSKGYFGNYDLHLISADNISKVHLIKGPVSHRYGFNSMGGMINIITDDLDEESIVKLKTQYSNHGKGKAIVSGSYGLGRAQLYLNASYLQTPGFVMPGKMNPLESTFIEEGGKRRTNAERDQYSINMRLLTDIAGIHTFSVAGGYSYVPLKGNPPSIYDNVSNRYSKIEDWERINCSISSKSSFSDSFELVSSIYYDRSEDTYIRFTDAEYNIEDWRSLIRTNTAGININVNRVLWDYFNNDLGLRLENNSYKRTGGPGYVGKWVDNSQTMHKLYHSVMLPDEGEVFSLTIGNAVSGYTHSQINTYNTFWEPQAGLIYRLRDKTFSLSYGLTNQFPTMHELYSSTSGNPELKPERASKAEGAVTFPVNFVEKRLDVTAVLFYNRVRNLIRRDRNLYYNQHKMSNYGGEMSFGLSLIPGLQNNFEISYIKPDKKNSSVELIDYPAVKLRLAHSYKISDNLFLSQSSQWFDRSLTYYSDDDYYNLPSYWTHDLGLKYFFRRANISFNVNNLLDAYYEPQYGYPAPGREVTVALEVPLM